MERIHRVCNGEWVPPSHYAICRLVFFWKVTAQICAHQSAPADMLKVVWKASKISWLFSWSKDCRSNAASAACQTPIASSGKIWKDPAWLIRQQVTRVVCNHANNTDHPSMLPAKWLTPLCASIPTKMAQHVFFLHRAHEVLWLFACCENHR